MKLICVRPVKETDRSTSLITSLVGTHGRCVLIVRVLESFPKENLMMSNLVVYCPPMPVIATSYWNPFADREAQELVCVGESFYGSFSFIFPKCKVRRISTGHWMVGSVLAEGKMTSGDHFGARIWCLFPEEPVVRDGWYMVAQPIDSLDGALDAPYKSYPIKMSLPTAIGKPVGLGLRKFIVEAVTIYGTVED